MTQAPHIALLIPTYQEGRVIRATLTELLSLSYTLIVIDDGSTDDTFQQVQDLPIHYLRHSLNLGQGAALMTGMEYAHQIGADIVVHFDADGQHRPEDIAHILAPILTGKADVVMGSRFLSKEGRALIPPLRRGLLRSAILVNWLLTGIR